LALAVLAAPLLAGAAEDEKELKVLKTGPALGKFSDTARGTVFHSMEDLMVAMGAPPAVVKDPKNQGMFGKMLATRMGLADAIDWKKQMVILVSAPRKPTPYAIEVTKVTVKDKTATVHWKEKELAKGTVTKPDDTLPARLVLVERFDGDVTFDPPIAEAKKEDKEKDKAKDK
jgi:hypothetical protein